jgi:sugar (pentulose or hexulose) kinase
MEYGDASGTGLFDVRKRRWCAEVVRAIDPELAGKLPDVQASDQPVGRLGAEAAAALGLPRSVLVSAGGGDNMMGAIGTGNTRPGMVTASLGTSGTIYAYSSRPVVDPCGEIAAFCDSTGAWMPLLCTMNVTVATEMVRRMLGWTYARMDREIATVPAGSDGLLLAPYLEGERTPNVPGGTGTFLGVNTHTFHPAHLARATMEGVTLGMNYGLDRLRGLGIRPKQIRVTGGGANSRVWRQIMADVFGCDVIGMKTGEGAAYGAALQAWWCFERERGNRVTISEITDRCVRLDPRTAASPCPAHGKVYRRLQELQNRAPGDLQEMFRLHRELGS